MISSTDKSSHAARWTRKGIGITLIFTPPQRTLNRIARRLSLLAVFHSGSFLPSFVPPKENPNIHPPGSKYCRLLLQSTSHHRPPFLLALDYLLPTVALHAPLNPPSHHNCHQQCVTSRQTKNPQLDPSTVESARSSNQMIYFLSSPLLFPLPTVMRDRPFLA